MSGKPIGRTNERLLETVQEYLRRHFQQECPDKVLCQGWEEFYRTYTDVIRRFALRQGLRGDDVDDCLQEVWADVVRRLRDFTRPRHRPGLRAWLFTIVRHKATDLIRRRARRPAASLEQAKEAGRESGTAALDPARLCERACERALMERLQADLLREVSETNAQLFLLRCVEGQEVAAVAAALGLTREQVWYREYRLLKKLRERLALYTGQPVSGEEGGLRDEPGEPPAAEGEKKLGRQT